MHIMPRPVALRQQWLPMQECLRNRDNSSCVGRRRLLEFEKFFTETTSYSGFLF
jgi:hypothetical protein